MSFVSNLKGINGAIFGFLNNLGILLKDDTGVLAVRNNADAAYAIARAADAVGDDDLVNKRTLATLTSQPLKKTVAQTTVSTTGSFFAGCEVNKVVITITTPYSVGGTLDVGIGGATTKFASSAAGDVNPQVAGVYVLDGLTIAQATAVALLITVGGAPAAGACTVEVFNSIPVT